MNTRIPIFIAIALTQAPTAVLDSLAQADRELRGARNGRPSTDSLLSRDELQLLRIPISKTESALRPSEQVVPRQMSRDTTPREHAIGELRRWEQLPADWDGEGAAAPNLASLREASKFACLRPADADVEPMLHASGRAGLYFRTPTLYADIEFFGDGRVAYFIERSGDRHKGVINFDSTTMPAVLATLLQA